MSLRVRTAALLGILVLIGASSPAFVRQPVDARIYPGISVAVGSVAKGVIAADAYGYANLAARVQLTPDTPMHIASVSNRSPRPR